MSCDHSQYDTLSFFLSSETLSLLGACLSSMCAVYDSYHKLHGSTDNGSNHGNGSSCSGNSNPGNSGDGRDKCMLFGISLCDMVNDLRLAAVGKLSKVNTAFVASVIVPVLARYGCHSNTCTNLSLCLTRSLENNDDVNIQ